MAEKSKEQAFFEKYLPGALKAQGRYGVPVSATLAAAALESGWGESGLASQALNFFGIKADSGWKGDVYYANTYEEINGQKIPQMAGFRKYTSADDAMLAYGDFLTKNQRYKSAFTTSNSTEFIQAVAAAGYATDSSYADKVTSIIQKYNLTGYDTKPGERAYKEGDPLTLDDDIAEKMREEVKNFGWPGQDTVIGSTFGKQGDTSTQEANDRFSDLNPGYEVPDVGGFFTGAAKQVTRIVVIILVVAVIVVAVFMAVKQTAVKEAMSGVIPQ